MPLGLTVLAVAAVVLWGTAAAAQIPAPSPPGPFAIDLRVGVGGIPRDPLFYPALATAQAIPGRALALDVGGQVLLVPVFGAARLGVGLNVLVAHGATDPALPRSSAGTPAGTALLPGRVEVDVRAVSPSVTLNFGTARGWSYVVAGLGSVSLTTRTTGANAVERPHGAVRDLSFGGGARWFSTAHAGFTFDVRFHRLAAGTATPPAMFLTALAGVSFK